MAKSKGGSTTSNKITFGKKGLGKAKKSFNKHDSKETPYRDWETDRKSTRLNSSHSGESRMPSSA